MRQELNKHEKEKLKQASTTNRLPPKLDTSQKHTVKVGKGKDQGFYHLGRNRDNPEHGEQGIHFQTRKRIRRPDS